MGIGKGDLGREFVQSLIRQHKGTLRHRDAFQNLRLAPPGYLALVARLLQHMLRQLIYGLPLTSTRVLRSSWITWIDFSKVHPAKSTSSTARAFLVGLATTNEAPGKPTRDF